MTAPARVPVPPSSSPAGGSGPARPRGFRPRSLTVPALAAGLLGGLLLGAVFGWFATSSDLVPQVRYWADAHASVSAELAATEVELAEAQQEATDCQTATSELAAATELALTAISALLTDGDYLTPLDGATAHTESAADAGCFT
jgi:hypothetical protein